MKADSSDILTYINNNKRIYEVPPYQRNYTWDRKQCKKLFNDLVFCQDRKKKHFLGTVVLMPSPKTENTYNYYEIIDGQQRFITLMLLLKALAEKDLSDADEIKKTYLFSEGDCEHDKLKLLPTKDDEKSFKDILYNRFDNKFKNQRLIKNYNFFQRSIHESDISPKDLYLALKKFEIVYIELGDQPEDENPQLVFESLNSTGARLKPIDLVRNYLLMSFKNPGLQRSAYKDYWVGLTKKFKENELSIFLRYYLVLKSHRKVRESQIYEEYKNFFESKRIKPDEAMEDLSQYVSLFYVIN